MTVATLWLPILLSAVLVFVASSLVHMVFKWHESDYRPVANEDAVREAIRAGAGTPGQYFIPHCPEMKLLREPQYAKKFEEGPIALITVRPNGAPHMGAPLAKWFCFTLAVSIGAACIGSMALAQSAGFSRVFWMTGLVAFMTYGGGSITDGIWKGQPWSIVAKDLLDAAIYAAITGAVMAALWGP